MSGRAARAFIVGAFLVLSAATSEPASIPSGMVEKGWEDVILQGVAKVSNTEYDEGLKLFDDYIRAFPKNSEGYFYSSAALQEKIQKLNDLGELDRFYKNANACKRICEARLEKNPNDSISRMYLGAVLGYMGLVEARQRNLVLAFLDAVDAKSHLERALKERPDITDIHFGLGMIYYFASKKSSEVGGMTAWIITKFITNGRDLRNEGLEMINKAVEGNAIARDYARAAIMWISLYEKKYPRVRELALDIASRFPKDAGSRWALGRIALVNHDCAEAKARYDEVLEILRRRGLPPSRYQDVEIGLKFADLCESMDHRAWEESARLVHLIGVWLDNDPKISLEYQDEKNLLAHWRSELDAARRSLRFFTSS